MSLSVLCLSERARSKGVARILVSILGVLFLSSSLYGQANQGRILGTVRDQSGGTIAGATVTVTDTLKNVTRTLTTDEAGEYAAPNLDPSTYMVHAEYKGFKAFQREGLVIAVGQEAKVDIVMQPGEQTQTVVVTEDVPLVETTSATLTGNITTQTIADLPLNGRNFVNLLTLRPGFVNQPGGGGGNQASMGMRPGDSMFFVDGLNMYEWGQGQQLLNGYAPAGDAATLLPIDSIQDFNIQQDPKAEMGWKPGVAINVGLKAGTNSLHGTAYAFGRDGSWDAQNVFQPGPPVAVPSLGFEQYGVTAGGPILKDKLFWYAAYESQLLNLGITSGVFEPVDASIGSTQNSIVDACNAIGRANVAPLSAQLAGLSAGSCTPKPVSSSFENLFPFNSGTQFSNSPTQVVPQGLQAMSDVNTIYNGLIKVDYHMDDKNSFSGMFFNGQGSGTWNDNPSAIASAFYESLFPVHARVGSGSWTTLPTSNVVNEFKVGYTHYRLPFFSVDHNANPDAPWGLSGGIPTGYGINSGVSNPLFYGQPFVSISGFTRLGGNWPKIVGPNQNIEMLEHYSLLHGKNAFKFGVEYAYVETTSGATSDAKGIINFKKGSGLVQPETTKIPNSTFCGGSCTALENYLLGVSGSGSKIFEGNPVRDVHSNHIAAFWQDDYRATSKLTINVGVRWEFASPWVDANNDLGSFNPNSTFGFVQVGNGITAAYNPDYRDWSPRVGFAWDIFGNQKTVLRAGAGLLYEFTPSSAFLNSGGNSVGLGKVPTGAQLCFTPAPSSCVQGPGDIAAATISASTSSVTNGWENNGPGTSIFNGGTVTCSPTATCSSAGFDRNLRTPYVETWNIDIQHSFTNNLSMDLAYIGNHGVKILGTRDINAPAVGSGYSAGGLAACAADFTTCGNLPDQAELGPFSAKFPYISYIDYLSNQDKSHYNGLQASLTQRASHGLSFTAAYTYSHALDDASQNFGSSIPLNNANPNLDYGNSDYDIRNRFTLEATWAIPGRKSPGQILEGWEITSIVTLQPGTPWSVQDTADDFSGTNEVNNPNAWGEAWDFFGNRKDFKAVPNGISFFPGGNSQNAPTGNNLCDTKAASIGPLASAALFNTGCYVSGNSVLIPPAYGTYGTIGRNIFLNPNFRTWDLSVFKTFKIKERISAQFRAEFFNVLNHPVFGEVDSGHLANNDPSALGLPFGAASETPDQASGNPVLGSGSSRDIQLGLKLIF
jgi:hypothetical protein